MASQMINNSQVEKFKAEVGKHFMVIRNTYPNHSQSSDFLCFLLTNNSNVHQMCFFTKSM